ncbi:MAG TPA: serine hydrolase domain-containing protein, partial [Mycobacteriales bacterium]
MPIPPAAVRAACGQVDAVIRSDPRYAHTSAFRVEVDGEVAYAARYGGPALADVFSVTKTVLATVAGVAARLGRLPPLDDPVDAYVWDACGVDLAATPSAGVTWRQLLTMTRGAEVEGPYEIDEVTALPSGWVRRVAEAPRREEPGRTFRYDNGAAHLLSAALTGALGEGVDAVAERELFRPLGIEGADWLRDPDGIACGAGFLRLGAEHLAALGRLWLDGGRLRPDSCRSGPDSGPLRPDGGRSGPDNGPLRPDGGRSAPDRGRSGPDNDPLTPDGGRSAPD